MAESSIRPIKFLCSYGGRILPRHPDGKLRYHGGETRLLPVDTSISFSELLTKMGEMCGSSVSLRCQLPTEDLDSLVSITSDEDLANLIEEYDRAAAAPPTCLKFRAFLSGVIRASPPLAAASFSSHASTPRSHFRWYSGGGGKPPRSLVGRPHRRLLLRPPAYPVVSQRVAGRFSHQFANHYHVGHGGVGRLIHKGNHW